MGHALNGASTMSRPRKTIGTDHGPARRVRLAMFSWFTVLATAGTAPANEPTKPSPGPKPEYNRDIRPILAEGCFRCHGPDSASRKADLRLDKRQGAVDSGAIVPGDVKGSEILQRINSTDPDEVMPPPSTKKTLTAEQKAMLTRWIASGAEYQPHWSLIAPKRPALPVVKDGNWVRNPVDRFILATLESKGLKPAPEADRRTLARRLSLDLTGLPPEPEVVDNFVKDTAADAYERLVDRFLASDRWGEHRARYWLDVARYADTHGIHFDNYRENWAYREWVIKAFNRNMPFDAFTVEQLAGDLLPNRTLDQQIASAFNRCNITTNEGGAIAEEYAVLYTRDRTETTSLVWLGLTAGCAVCHDHKFDPLSQKEFYSLAAFFNNTTQNAMDGNIKDTPPTVFVPRTQDKPRWDTIEKDLARVKAESEGRRAGARGEFEKWLADPSTGSIASSVPALGLKLLVPLAEGAGTTASVVQGGTWKQAELGDKAVWVAGQLAAKALQFKPGVKFQVADAGDFEKNQGFSYGAWVNVPAGARQGAALARMDEANDYRGWDLWIENNKVGAHIINKWPDDALKVVSKTQIPSGKWSHVFISYDGSGKASGVKVFIDGRPQPVDVVEDRLKNTIRNDTPLQFAQRSSPSSRIDNLALQDVRVYDRTLSEAEVTAIVQVPRVLWLASQTKAKRAEAETNELFDFHLNARDPVFQKLASTLASLRQEQAALRATGTIAHVMQEKSEAAMAYLLYRGEYDKRRDPLKPSTPDAWPPFPSELPANRLGFAKWLLLPDQPLTARVTVNRFWQDVFGTGMVRTSGDFGVSGELPSHPELLDWLAVDFRDGGWDVKKLIRLYVTSATYRQSAVNTPEKLEIDPQNRLLSRGPRFRMDAEMVRDHALASSGLLVDKLGGPSVKPYQPEGVWEAVAMIGSNTRDYKRDSGENLYRRSLYTFWKRSAPPASMDIFNAPSREVCTVRRERTNTPLQALATLNDPQLIEAARRLAERVLSQGGATEEGRFEFLAKRVLSRPFKAEEEKIIRESLAELAAFYKGHSAEAKELITVGESRPDPRLDAATLAAWTMVTNEIMNLDEVLCK